MTIKDQIDVLPDDSVINIQDNSFDFTFINNERIVVSPYVLNLEISMTIYDRSGDHYIIKPERR